MRTILSLSLLTVALAAAGCGSGSDDAASGTTGVVAGFYPVAWAAEQVAGDRVAVTNLTPAGAEPHDLELSARQVGEVRSAEVVLAVRGFQPALDDAAGDNAIDLLEGLDVQAPAEDDRHGDEETTGDPHVWLDPTLFAEIARRLGRTLGTEQGGEALARRLEELDAELRAGLAACERREIVTAHAAFGYLAERYGLEQIAIAGLSPEAEPSPQALAGLVEEVRDASATTVFVEPLVSPRVAETIARETGAAVAVLDPIEGLTAAQQEDGADYFSLMRENLAALQKALGCRQPSS